MRDGETKMAHRTRRVRLFLVGVACLLTSIEDKSEALTDAISEGGGIREVCDEYGCRPVPFGGVNGGGFRRLGSSGLSPLPDRRFRQGMDRSGMLRGAIGGVQRGGFGASGRSFSARGS